MSLKAKIEAIIYASEEPVTLGQLLSLLGEEAHAELDRTPAQQGQLALLDDAGLMPAQEADHDHKSTPDLAGLGLNTSSEAKLGTPTPGTITQTALVRQIEPAPAELRATERRVREYLRSVLDRLIGDYRDDDCGLEIREIAGGFRFATKPEYHDAVRGFVRSLKPALKLSLQALETLAVVAYKQPVTAPEVADIRGVDSGGVLGSLMTRKLVTTAGRKQVIGRPILYKTTKEFLLRFGLKDVAELPSIEEFERLASGLSEPADTVEVHPEETSMPDTPLVPVRSAATARPLSPEEVAREVEPNRMVHAAQADGDPNAGPASADEVSEEHLSPAPDGPGEFTGNETVPPAENTVNDGRLSGMPPSYNDTNNEITDSPANDARVQSAQPEQMENVGSDD